MGDAETTDLTAPEASSSPYQDSTLTDSYQAYGQGGGNMDVHSSYPLQYQPQFGNPQHAFSSQFDMTQPQGQGRGGPYNMSGLVNTLPQANYRQGPFNPSQQRYNPSASAQGLMGQMQAMSQYGGQAGMNHMPNQPYYMQQQQAQMAHYYGTPLSPSQQQPGISTRASHGYYPNQMMTNQQQHPSAAYYYAQASHFSPQGQSLSNQGFQGQYMSSPSGQADSGIGSSQNGDPAGIGSFPQVQEPTQSSVENRSNVVRGPPRKPRQSGHAIWIGNLPPQTDLMSLVHHVCKEAGGLESLFLISKSNCAFANFKDEAACVTAQQKLHDSKFQSVRLVSRLRKSTVEGATGVTAPTGPAASTPQQANIPEIKEAKEEKEEKEDKEDIEDKEQEPVILTKEVPQATLEPETSSVPTATGANPSSTGTATPQKDKFFILKSLTLEDLELSVRTGIWATQSHNEESLNAAFQSVDSVYLVFSANKSGEYFGYARMTSAINDDPAAAIEFAPKAQSANDVDLPKAIPTEATEFAPKGRIIDDSARGTIFWEAERDDSSTESSVPEPEDAAGETDAASSTTGSGQEGGEAKAWGKPFKLEWLSANRLPFYRCRGLRNPWNSNREVKIARDGTELEPSVGRKLIGLFNRVQSPAPGAMRQGGPTMPMAMMGYPPMRAPYQQ